MKIIRGLAGNGDIMRQVNAVFVLRINALQKITARIIFKLRSVKGDFVICKPSRCKLIFGDSRISEKEYEINKRPDAYRRSYDSYRFYRFVHKITCQLY